MVTDHRHLCAMPAIDVLNCWTCVFLLWAEQLSKNEIWSSLIEMNPITINTGCYWICGYNCIQLLWVDDAKIAMTLVITFFHFFLETSIVIRFFVVEVQRDWQPPPSGRTSAVDTSAENAKQPTVDVNPGFLALLGVFSLFTLLPHTIQSCNIIHKLC